MKNTKSPVKFWFLKNYLSPTFQVQTYFHKNPSILVQSSDMPKVLIFAHTPYYDVILVLYMNLRLELGWLDRCTGIAVPQILIPARELYYSFSKLFLNKNKTYKHLHSNLPSTQNPSTNVTHHVISREVFAEECVETRAQF